MAIVQKNGHKGQYGSMISDMYDLFKPILERNPDYIILHIGTNNASKNTANERLDKILALKSLVASNSQNFKVIISTLTMRVDDQKCRSVVIEVKEFLKNLIFNILVVNNKNIIRKYLGNKGFNSIRMVRPD